MYPNYCKYLVCYKGKLSYVWTILTVDIYLKMLDANNKIYKIKFADSVINNIFIIKNFSF